MADEKSSHYNVGGNQWLAGDFIREAGLGFDEGCVVKYVARHKRKGGEEDIKKAIDYLKHILVVDYGHKE